MMACTPRDLITFSSFFFFFFNDTPTTEIYTLSLHDALPIRRLRRPDCLRPGRRGPAAGTPADRKSTRLNSSHVAISYAVFCLKKKNIIKLLPPRQIKKLRLQLLRTIHDYRLRFLR